MTLSPCDVCAKAIINAGIEEVESCYPDGGPYKVCEELKQMDTLKYEGKPTPRVKVFKRVKQDE